VPRRMTTYRGLGRNSWSRFSLSLFFSLVFEQHGLAHVKIHVRQDWTKGEETGGTGWESCPMAAYSWSHL
jgi:hypothetical protein